MGMAAITGNMLTKGTKATGKAAMVIGEAMPDGFTKIIALGREKW